MRRTASEIINDLERRVARLERQASHYSGSETSLYTGIKKLLGRKYKTLKDLKRDNEIINLHELHSDRFTYKGMVEWEEEGLINVDMVNKESYLTDRGVERYEEMLKYDEKGYFDREPHTVFTFGF